MITKIINGRVISSSLFKIVQIYHNCTTDSQKVRSCICGLLFEATLKPIANGRMFRRLVQPLCKHLKTLYRFYITLQSSKSEADGNWCHQMWNVCSNMFFTCWWSASCSYSWVTHDGLQCGVYSIEKLRKCCCEFMEGRLEAHDLVLSDQ